MTNHANRFAPHHNPPRGLFITGTDTGVGKTFVASRIVGQMAQSGLRVGAYKPAASGISPGEPSDPESLYRALAREVPQEWVCPQKFVAPLAPPAAAASEGKAVDEALLLSGSYVWHGECDYLLVEGAGGWRSPLSERWTNAELAQKLGFPVVVVAANRLGVINHTMLTIESIERMGLSVAAILLNQATANADDLSVQSNQHWLQRFVSVPVLRVDHDQSAVPVTLDMFQQRLLSTGC